MRAIVVSLFILLWSIPTYAACSKDEVCKLMGKMVILRYWTNAQMQELC